jgi:hypothetical protein
LTKFCASKIAIYRRTTFRASFELELGRFLGLLLLSISLDISISSRSFKERLGAGVSIDSSLSDTMDSTSGTSTALLSRPLIWKTAFAMAALPAVENSVTDPNIRNSDYLF